LISNKITALCLTHVQIIKTIPEIAEIRRITASGFGEERSQIWHLQTEEADLSTWKKLSAPGSNHQCILAINQDRNIHLFSLPGVENPGVNRAIWKWAGA